MAISHVCYASLWANSFIRSRMYMVHFNKHRCVNSRTLMSRLYSVRTSSGRSLSRVIGRAADERLQRIAVLSAAPPFPVPFIRTAPPLCHSCHFGFVPLGETKPETRYRQGADRTKVTRQYSDGYSQHLAQRYSCCCRFLLI